MARRPVQRLPVPVRVVLLTMDTHLAGTVIAVRRALQRELPGLTLTLHAASEWTASAEGLASAIDDAFRYRIRFASRNGGTVGLR